MGKIFTLVNVIFLICATTLIAPAPVQVAEAVDFASLRSWVTIEIPYYGTDSILVKLTAVTNGNHLSHGMWIDKIIWGNPDTNVAEGNITISSGLTVVVGRAVIEAEYSVDSNTTKFTYTVSSDQYEIKPSGIFPYDQWGIEITFHINFKADFDPRMKYCLTPSLNYYGSYSTTYNYEEQGSYYYSLKLRIAHPPSFVTFVFCVYLPPIILLGVLALVCTYFLWKRRKHIEKLAHIFIAICSAVIVFIPIYQLSTQELKTPFALTWVDWSFTLLLAWYIGLVCFTIGKAKTKCPSHG